MNQDLIIFLHLAILGFWLFATVKNIIFWTYIWQTKEYRRDRLSAYFELPSSRRLILNLRLLFSVIVLVMGIVMLFVDDFWYIDWGFSIAILSFYVLMFLRLFEQIRRKEVKLPDFTGRAIMVLVVSVFIYLASVLSALQFNKEYIIVVLVILDILAPIICSVGVVISTPLVKTVKNRILSQARLKIGRMQNLLVIGVTGSYGKTSTKEFIATLLSENFNVLTTEKNNNTEMSVARTILNKLKPSHEVFVVEMGAYRIGEIALTASVAKPKIGVLTGIGPQHLSLFGSLQNTQRAKYELIESLPPKGLAIFNGDNDIVRKLYHQCNRPKRLYASNALVDIDEPGIKADEINYMDRGTSITIKEGSKNHTIITDLLGNHNVSNLMGAITVAREMGMSFDEIKKGIKKIESVEHTLKPLHGINGTLVVDDSYSGNVHGVFAALDVLDKMQGNKKVMVILPLIELGDMVVRAHREIGAKIGQVCDYCIVVSNDYFPELYEEAVKNGMNKDNMLCITNPKTVIKHISEMTESGDIILLENRINQYILNNILASKNGKRPKVNTAINADSKNEKKGEVNKNKEGKVNKDENIENKNKDKSESRSLIKNTKNKFKYKKKKKNKNKNKEDKG